MNKKYQKIVFFALETLIYGIMLGLVIVYSFSFNRQIEYIYGGL